MTCAETLICSLDKLYLPCEKKIITEAFRFVVNRGKYSLKWELQLLERNKGVNTKLKSCVYRIFSCYSKSGAVRLILLFSLMNRFIIYWIIKDRTLKNDKCDGLKYQAKMKEAVVVSVAMVTSDPENRNLLRLSKPSSSEHGNR